MGASSEIKPPPECPEEAPAMSITGKSESISSMKLDGIHLTESDNWHIGTTPVDIRGKPIPDHRLPKTGGWIAVLFIFGNEMAEKMCYFGLAVNMVLFMFNVMHKPFSGSASLVSNFLGISQVSSIIGGFLADAYLGRYWTIASFTTLYFVGLIGITISATVKAFMPDQNCTQFGLLLGTCDKAKPWQMIYLNTVLYASGLGSAGIRPCVSSFGADQFDERTKNYQARLDSFFNFFYLFVSVGAIAAFTLIVYFQMQKGWGYAFGALAVGMGISNILFFVGTPLYRHRLPGGSPLTRVAQVLVAAFRKRNASFESTEFVGLYEISGNRSAIKGSAKIAHTNDLRFLDKAALQLEEDSPDPWRLCTITQVEEVKILIKLIPIPLLTIVMNLIVTEYLTLSVQQAYTMNTYLGHFKVPVTCMPVFPALSIFLFLSLYYYTFVPLARLFTGHPHGATQLQRIGIGLVFSILSAAWAGILERYRRNYAIKHEFEEVFLSAMPGFSAYWLVIQYCLIGIAEVFATVALLEFLYEEAPDAMRSVGSAYAALAGGIGSFLTTPINNIVKSLTGNEAKGKESWLAMNVNKGRFDYFYWLLAGLSVINFMVFLYVANRYKYRAKQKN
ncbi:hypothetical protein K2173_006878 [Erythroxylum novogranatense]|uniref:Major facilitator superfamily protein n=1 Tax=Erythroxylum novogranatense TaxID=1862640 RepID=A0AAV8SYH0_9ROSI|nr:hypothetical protein K2173_006878 [Erythroxylum novogranatense]